MSPREQDGRAAMDRLARRISEQSERAGRKVTHDEAMKTARAAAKRHDKRSR